MYKFLSDNGLFGSIGSLGKANSSAYVQNVSLDGAYLFNTENGLRIKTWQVIFPYKTHLSFYGSNIFKLITSTVSILDLFGVPIF